MGSKAKLAFDVGRICQLTHIWSNYPKLYKAIHPTPIFNWQFQLQIHRKCKISLANCLSVCVGFGRLFYL